MFVLSSNPVQDCTVSVPGSKSYTHRILIAAALAEGTSRVVNALRWGHFAKWGSRSTATLKTSKSEAWAGDLGLPPIQFILAIQEPPCGC